MSVIYFPLSPMSDPPTPKSGSGSPVQTPPAEAGSTPPPVGRALRGGQSESRKASQPEREKQSHAVELTRRVHHIEQRDFQLWSIVVLLILVMAAGFLALIVPNIFWSARIFHADGRYVPQLFFGFIVLVALVNIYLISQRRQLVATREQLLHEMLERQSAEQLALMDSLTETYNRRYLHEVISKDFQRAQRHGIPLTFLMIDVDKFKAVNTKFGHIVGDRVLSEVAYILKTTFRAADTIIRYGGDEFLVMLDGCDEEHARSAVLRLEKQVTDWNQKKSIAGYEMKLSTGFAHHQDGETLESVLQRADQQMYQRKIATP